MNRRTSPAIRLYRAALRVYPRRIREPHGDEIADMFADEWRRARTEGRMASWRAAGSAVRDLIVNGGAARARVLVGMDPGKPVRGRLQPWGGWEMETMAQDLRHAARGLLRTPGFTAVAILTLALGIGGNTAIYSIVDAAFLDALPFPDDEELVVLYNAPLPDRGSGFAAFSAPFQLAFEAEEALASVGAIAPRGLNVGGPDQPERVTGAAVSASFFHVAGVPPQVGRTFVEEEDRPGAGAVAVLGHGLWNRRFAADPSVVGTTLVVGDTPTTIVGIMPEGFELILPDVELWIPLVVDEAALDATSAVNNNRVLVARLPAGVSADQVRGRMGGTVDRVRARFPGAVTDDHLVHAVPLRRHLYGSARSNLLLLFGAVALVLLIACANLANLLLVRAEKRRQELAVRAALGAGRRRIVGQLLAESGLLSIVGGAAGAGFAGGLLALVRPLAPPNVPLPPSPALDGSVLLFTLGIALVTGTLFGILPAWSITRGELRGALVEGGRGGTGGRRSRVRGALVVAEVALTAVLLVGSGLLLHSLGRLQDVDTGFDAEDRLVIGLNPPTGRYPDAPSMTAFYRTLLERIDAVPGVTAAGLTQWVPLGNAANWGFEADGAEEVDLAFADYTLVTPGYLETVGMEVVRGRALEWADAEPDARPVMLVSESMAAHLWPDADPVGRRINIDLGPSVWREVVGVVSDVRNRSLSTPPSDLMYFPTSDLPMSDPRGMSLVVHHAGIDAPLSELRSLVAELDPSIPMSRVNTLSSIAGRSESRRVFVVTLLGLFAGIALVLAAVGLYGVISYTFSLRTREIGLRMAVGAHARQVLALVVRQSGALVALGLALGLGVAVASSRVIESLLFDVDGADPVTYALVSVFLTLVCALATWVPAARAVRVDPTTALRE